MMFLLTAVLLLGQIEVQDLKHVHLSLFNPPDSCTGRGMYLDVISRCPVGERHKIGKYDRVIGCHEITHIVNNHLRNTTQRQCFYMGGGKVMWFAKHPKTTLARVAFFVPTLDRTSTYKTYCVDAQKDWGRHPLYLIDEWVAYKNDIRVSKEERLPTFGSEEFDRNFVSIGNALLSAVRVDHPDYPERQALIEFVEYLKRN